MKIFIVEISIGVYLADWSGDPGRTVIINHAKKYETERAAKIAIKKARKYRAFKEAKIIKL